MPKIDCAVATQTKGEAQALWLAMNPSMVLTSWATLSNEPRLMARWLMSPNQRSTWFSHEAEVGVK